MHVYPLHEVFGLTPNLLRTYVERPALDWSLKEALSSGQLVVIHGNSKQGKTSLCSKWVGSKTYSISCTPTQTKQQIYELLLGSRDVVVAQEIRSISREAWRSHKGKKMGLGSLGEFGLDRHESNDQDQVREISSSHLPINTSDPNTVSRLLRRASRQSWPIVIDDFHRLDSSVQKQIIDDLKVFWDNSQPFLIIGVWRQEDRLSSVNGDLDSRVMNIDANRWTGEQLRGIVSTGSGLLNIRIPRAVEDRLIQLSVGNVGILQECLARLCVLENISETSKTHREVGSLLRINEIAAEISRKQESRFHRDLSCLAQSRDEQTSPSLKDLIVAILESPTSSLERGQPVSILAQQVKRPNARKIPLREVTEALTSLKMLQSRCRIEPPIFEFYADKLCALDSRFLFFHEKNNMNHFLRRLGLIPGSTLSLPTLPQRRTCDLCGWAVPDRTDLSRIAEALRDHSLFGCDRAEYGGEG